MSKPCVPENPNLTVYNEPHFRGLPIMVKFSPFVYEYLECAWKVLELVKTDYPRFLALRIDLRYPHDEAGFSLEDNQVMERFKKALDSRIAWQGRKKEASGVRVHPCRARMIWAREQYQSEHPHYHVVLLLNWDRYFRLGDYSPHADSLMGLIQSAWASAVGIAINQVNGLVHVPGNACYKLSKKDGYAAESDLFHRISYLCKLNTKTYGQRYHNFGASRR